MRYAPTIILIVWLLRASIAWEEGLWLNKEMDESTLALSFPEQHETLELCADSLQNWVTRTLHYWRWLQSEILDTGTRDTHGRTRLSARGVKQWGVGNGVLHFWCVPDEVS